MKKDRNCGMNPYPVYQPYPQVGPMMNPSMMAPNMIPPVMAPGNVQMSPQYSISQDNVSSNTIEQQMAQMQRQINNLDARVSKLESSINTIGSSSFNSNQYSSGNYHIV